MMKFLVILSIIVLTNCAADFKRNALRVFNLDYTRASGERVKLAFKYTGIEIGYQVVEETDYDQTVLKFVWTYSNEQEKSDGQGYVQKMSGDFENVAEDGATFSLNLLGKDLQKIKMYKKTEFGSAYVLEFNQKNVLITAQIQVKAHEANEDDFNTVLTNITSKRSKNEFLQFLEN
jgi:hypothetical protein